MKVLDRRALAEQKGIRFHNVHLLRLEKAGKFPRRFLIGANRTAWLETEIDEWLEQRVAARDAANAT